MSLDSVHIGRRIKSESQAAQTDTHTNRGRESESVNHALIFQQISPLGDPATQSMTALSHEKCGCTQMPNSNEVASNEMLWARVLSLLVVGASVLAGGAVVLIQALQPILHEFP
jgi:hypothetical protein